MWMPLDDGKGERDLQKTKVMRTRRECVYTEVVQMEGLGGLMACVVSGWWVVGAAHAVQYAPPMAFDYARH